MDRRRCWHRAASTASGDGKLESLSDNAMEVTYKATGDGLSFSDKAGNSYTARFDGKDYPYKGDPGITAVGTEATMATTTRRRATEKDLLAMPKSFIAAGRFRDDKVPDDWGSLAPDLAVEVLSPGDRPRYVLDKVAEYLEAGVRLVWVIDPRKARAVVYRSLSDVHELGPEDALDGEDVLPGFRCTLEIL